MEIHMSDSSLAVRQFSLGAVLTVTTGRLLCDIGDLYKILDYMTGDTLFTHQLPRASEECQEPLLEQHPHLRGVEVPRLEGWEAYAAWLKGQAAVLGDPLEVQPLAAVDHTHIDPLVELKQMAGDKPIIVINREGEA